MSTLSPVSVAIADYARRARKELGADTEPVVSYAGIWLLLGALGTALDDDDARDFLGMPATRARAAVAELCAEPGVVHARIGGWLAAGARLIGVPPIELERGLDQARLDRWAAQATDGMIEKFPVQLEPETAIVVASALALAPQWTRALEELSGDRLGLCDRAGQPAGLQTVVDTRAAGPVVVAAPPSDDGVAAYSVIAAPDIAPERVWTAIDEALEAAAAGALPDRGLPAPDGHSWRTVTQTETLTAGSEPAAGEVLWDSVLPRWSATANLDVMRAPGVSPVAAALGNLLADPTEADALQSAMAEYTATGFRAAAVTAIGVRAMSLPAMVTVPVTRVHVTFDRPHALVAVGRNGAWDGVPLVHCWVGGPS